MRILLLSQFGCIHLYITMKYKNREPKRTFVPKKIGEGIWQELIKIIQVNLEKLNFWLSPKWPEIVGSFFADHSEPEKISRCK